MKRLAAFDLVYLGMPYTKHPGGIDFAFKEAARLTARLLKFGVKVYSPICHTHPVAVHGGIDPLDLSIWLPFDAAMMNKADALCVAQMESWESSHGLAHEIDYFLTNDKPIFYLDPNTLALAVVR